MNNESEINRAKVPLEELNDGEGSLVDPCHERDEIDSDAQEMKLTIARWSSDRSVSVV